MREVLQTLGSAALVLIVAATAAAQTGATAAAGTIAVDAAAGVGGIARPGRWLPVWVTIDSASTVPVRARVRLSWGNAIVERELDLGSAGRREIEVYIRTPDVEETVAIDVETDTGATGAATAPVTIVPVTERVTACIVPSGTTASAAGCGTMVTPDRLPRSPRGYDAVNAIAWPAGPLALAPPYGAAITQWQSLNALEDAGDLGLTPQVTRPVLRRGLPGPTGAALVAGTAAYLLALSLLAFLMWRRRVAAPWLAGGAMATLAVACGGALWLGEMGPASAVRVHHQTLLQQIPGTTASLLTMRGVSEFPAFADYELRLAVTDGMLEPTSRPQSVSQRIDASGFPVMRGTFGLGARQAFVAEAISDVQLLAVTVEGSRVRITNISPWVLRECRFADVFTPAVVGVLEPRSSATGTQTGELLGPLATCVVDAPAAALEGSGRTTHVGTTAVAVYHAREPASSAAELAND